MIIRINLTEQEKDWRKEGSTMVDKIESRSQRKEILSNGIPKIDDQRSDKKEEDDARNSGTSSEGQNISADRKVSEVKVMKIPEILVNPRKFQISKSKAKRRPKQAKKLSPIKNQPQITQFTTPKSKTQLNPACTIEGNNRKITIGNKENLTGTQGSNTIKGNSQISESVILELNTDNLKLLKRTEVNNPKSNKVDSGWDSEPVRRPTEQGRTTS